VKPFLPAGLLVLLAQAGSPPTPAQDKVIDVRAARAPAGNTFEALWSTYEKAAAKNDRATAQSVLREVRRLRVERNILSLDTFALAHVTQGLAQLRKGDREGAESEFGGAAALDPYLPDAYFGMSLVELQKIPLGIVPAVREIVKGVTAPLKSARGRERAFSLGMAALLLTLFATATVVALALLLRHGTLLLHDLEESFGGGRIPALPVVIFAALLLLPALTLQGYGWLPFWWLMILFVYLSRLEKALVAVLMLLGLAGGPLVHALEDAAKAQQNRLFRASLSSLETGPDGRALLDLEDGVRKHTDDRDLVYLLALQYKKAGRYEEAAALYRDILRTEPADSIALNNLANVEFAAGEFAAAIARYKQGIESNPSPEVAATFYYNLSGAHLQRFEYQPAQEARSHADRASSGLVKDYDRLWKYDKGDYAVVDLGLDEDRISQKFAGVDDGVGRKNLAGKPPAKGGLERWLPAMRNRFSAMVGLFLVLTLGVARVRGGKMFTMHCVKCGTPFCRHCQLGGAAEGLCTQCHHLFMVRDGVSGPARNQKLLEVQKEDTRRGRIFRALSILSPGAGHVYAQRVLIGLPLVFVWYAIISLTLLGGRVLPFTEVSGTMARPWDLGLAAVLLLLTLIAANRIGPGFDLLMPARRSPAAAARRGRVA
jgi:tetratricopeptide (TPR) repeat protein